MPSTTGLGLAPSVIPGPNTTTRPCDRSVTATAAPYAASLIASSPCSLPCSVTKPSTTLHGLTPPTPSPHDHKHSLYKRWGVRSNRGRRLAPREASRSEADVLPPAPRRRQPPGHRARLPRPGPLLRIEGVLSHAGLAVAGEVDQVVGDEADVDHGLDVARLQGRAGHPPEDL